MVSQIGCSIHTLSSSISFLLLFSPLFSRSPCGCPLFMYHPSSLVFTWNPAIVSNLVALLDQLGHSEEAEALVFGATSKFESRNKELTLFYCKLLESHSTRGSQKDFDVA
ncbi:hypothetical protein HN51_004645 [Arachis hypogaea]